MKLIIVRHGQTNLNKQGRVLGHGPEPLNDTGHSQADAVAKALAQVEAEALYSSPINRTMQTAATISEQIGMPVTSKPGLAEIDAGEMEGVEGRKLGELFPDLMVRWRSDPGTTYPSGTGNLKYLHCPGIIGSHVGNVCHISRTRRDPKNSRGYTPPHMHCGISVRYGRIQNSSHPIF